MPIYDSHHFQVPRTAHYYTLGTPSPEIEEFWLVCHGYGQLGSEIIHKFTKFDDGKHLIVAPEGLSRFYWGGVTGKISASWMTSGDRLSEIDDYVNMIHQIYEKYTALLSPNVKINLFGFSQGVATQIRWMMAKFPKFDRLVLWAGTLPDDLDYIPHQDYFNSRELFWHCGKQDEYINDKVLNWHRGFIKKGGLNYEEKWFEGTHQIPREELEKHYLNPVKEA